MGTSCMVHRRQAVTHRQGRDDMEAVGIDVWRSKKEASIA